MKKFEEKLLLKIINKPIKLPPLKERVAVYNYLRRNGFSAEEAEEWPCIGREYGFARDAMLYEKIKNKAAN